MASQTLQVSLLPWCHRAPFDRMLVAQAQVEKLVLLAADEVLAAYGSVVHVALTGSLRDQRVFHAMWHGSGPALVRSTLEDGPCHASIP